MTIEKSREWLALLEAELARRAARVRWEADAGDRAREALIAQLHGMAERLAAAADKCPLEPVADMSPAEQLAIRWFWPEHLHPAGLASEDEILAPFARSPSANSPMTTKSILRLPQDEHTRRVAQSGTDNPAP